MIKNDAIVSDGDKDTILHELIQEEFEKTFSSDKVLITFLMVMIANILVNIDHGTLPACALEIKEKLKI
jgi:hypothetical protein